MHFIPEKHFPFKSRFLNYLGFNIHYIDEGQGDKVVLLLHGNPTWSFFYRSVIDFLRTDYRVIAMDYIGCGLSDHPTSSHFRAIDRVNEVEFLYRTLGLEKFSIIMHDWGGAIGTRFLQNHLDKVEKIIYLNTTLSEVESLPFMIKSSANPIIGPLLTKYTLNFLKYLTGPGSVKRLQPWVKSGYFYPYQTISRRTAIWDFVSDIPFSEDHPTYPEMTKLAKGFQDMQNIPIKIIWGLKDPCFHPYMLRKVSAHFPKAQVVEIPNAGHLLIEDEPDVVNQEIKIFLEDKNLLDTTNASAIYDFNQSNFTFSEESSINSLYKSFINNCSSVENLAAVITVNHNANQIQYSQITFLELKSRVFQYARGLAELEIKPGNRVLMLVPPGEEFLALSFAVMSRGAIPCFVDPGVGREKLFKCIRDCDPQVLIGAPKAHLLRLRGKRLFPNLLCSIWATDKPAFGGINLSYFKRFSALEIPPLSSPDGISMVAFTSGATGTPKGVIFTNSMVDAQLKIFKEQFGFKAGDKDLPLLPIFSIFSCAMGVSSVFAPINPARPLQLDPLVIIKTIQDLGIQTAFGSPTLWDKISEYGLRHAEKLVSIKKVLMAGAPVADEIFNRVSNLIPNGTAITPYGATECLPVTLAPMEEITPNRSVKAHEGQIGTPLGRPIKECQVKIVEFLPSIVRSINEVKEIPPFRIGEIIVSGKHISPAYLNRVDANLQGKIKDQNSFWHRLGDVGYFDDKGILYYCGRKSHVIFAQDKIYYPDPIENIFNRIPEVKRSALISMGKDEKGYSIPAVAIEPISGKFPRSQEEKIKFIDILRQHALDNEVTRQISNFYFFDKFPVDARHNAKIFRDILSEEVTRKSEKDKYQSKTPNQYAA